MRKANPTLTYGKYDLVDYDNPNVYDYTRTYKGDTCLALLDFSKTNASIKLPNVPKSSDVLINNYVTPSKIISGNIQHRAGEVIGGYCVAGYII